MPVYALPEHEFIEVSGEDARKFLQGQVSCNVELLSESRSLPGAICNLKGRVIADFRLTQASGACLMQTTAGMADTIIAALSRYAVFSRVELRRVQPPLTLGIPCGEYDIALAKLFPQLPDKLHECVVSTQMCLIRLPGGGFELWCFDESVIPSLRELLGKWRPKPGPDWLAVEIGAGIVHVSPAMSEQYTPQLLNYDLSGVINFSKGCYTGQEVVARMHFRGKPKKRMFLFESERPLDESSVICKQLAAFGEGGEPLLAYVNPSRGPSLALAVASIATVEAGEPVYLNGNLQAALFGEPPEYQQS